MRTISLLHSSPQCTAHQHVSFLFLYSNGSFCLFSINSCGSSVALENPDYSFYPRAECSMEFGQKVELEAGDALFIPEGW